MKQGAALPTQELAVGSLGAALPTGELEFASEPCKCLCRVPAGVGWAQSVPCCTLRAQGERGDWVWAGVCVLLWCPCRGYAGLAVPGLLSGPLVQEISCGALLFLSSAGMGVTLRNHSSRPSLRCFPWFGAGWLQVSCFMPYGTGK